MVYKICSLQKGQFNSKSVHFTQQHQCVQGMNTISGEISLQQTHKLSTDIILEG